MNQKGLTLIELMIVIAIIGILSAVALPAYHVYVVRARVTEGLMLAAPAKLEVTEAIILKNAFPENQQVTGYRSPEATPFVQSITIADYTGEIIIAFTPMAGNGTIIMAPTFKENDVISWTCTGGTLAKKYRPSNCK